MIYDWNVLATVRSGRFSEACETLQQFGKVSRTNYYNVVVIRVPDIDGMLETLRQWFEIYPDTAEQIAHVLPVRRAYTFADAVEFKTRSLMHAQEYLPPLHGKAFCVRIHRHGLKRELPAHEHEVWLGEQLLALLADRGHPGRVCFDDPDAVFAIVTLDHRAGTALWTREHLLRYPFLGVL
jgi:hypothetical protein